MKLLTRWFQGCQRKIRNYLYLNYIIKSGCFFFLQVTNIISPRAGSRESTLRTSFGSRRVFIHELFSIRDFLLNLVVDCSIVIWGPHFTSSTMEGTLTLFLTSTFFHPQLLFVTRDFCFSSKASVFHLRLFLIHDYFFFIGDFFFIRDFCFSSILLAIFFFILNFFFCACFKIVGSLNIEGSNMEETKGNNRTTGRPLWIVAAMHFSLQLDFRSSFRDLPLLCDIIRDFVL